MPGKITTQPAWGPVKAVLNWLRLNPKAIPLVLLSALSLGVVAFWYIQAFSRVPAGLEVVYREGYFEITRMGPHTAEVFRQLRPGDRIIAVNGSPVTLPATGDETSPVLLYPPRELSGWSELEPLLPSVTPVTGQPLEIWSIKASTLMVDFSHREGGSPFEFSYGGESSITATGREGLQLYLSGPPASLDRFFLNSGRYCVLVFLIMLGSKLFTTGRPNTLYLLLTLVVALTVAGEELLRVIPALPAKLVVAAVFPFTGLLWLHFMLQFLGIGKPERLIKFGLGVGYLGLTLLALLRIGSLVGPPLTGQTRQFLALLTYRMVYLPSLLALVLPAVIYLLNPGRARTGLRTPAKFFAIAAACLGVGIIAGSYSHDPDLPVMGLFSLPALIIPPVLNNAIPFSRSVGVSRQGRQFATHGFLTLLLLLGCLVVTGLLQSVFIRYYEVTSVSVVLVITLFTMSINLLREKLQKLVDRLFGVDPLDFGQLQLSWNARLASESSFEGVLETVVRDLPGDYHYGSAGLLVWQPEVLAGLALARAMEANALLACTGKYTDLDTKPVSLELTSILTGRLRREGVLAAGDPGNLPVIKHLDFLLPSYLIPVKLGEQLYGLLAMGEKYSGYRPSEEELASLQVVTGQIAVTLYGLVTVANEKVRQEFYKEQLNREEQARKEERLKISGLLHDKILPEMVSQLNALRRLKPEIGAGLPASDLELSLQMAEMVSTRLRDINSWLVPFSANVDLVNLLEDLYEQNRQDQPEIEFDFSFEGTRPVLCSLLDQEQKLVLYQVAHESTSNAVRHSGANLIRCRLCLEQLDSGTEEFLPIKPVTGRYQIVLEIADNGRGIDPVYLRQPEKLIREKHFGLETMKRRVELAGGTIEFRSEPKRGLKVVFTLPVNVE